MKNALILILALACLAFSQKVLHVSTIPSGADIYVGEIHPDHADMPQQESPAVVVINDRNTEDGKILISLFRPEFHDTTLRVTLSDKDTSYLIVSMRPTYDDQLRDEQQRILGKRSRRVLGHRLMWSSIISFAVSAISGALTVYYIDKADESKETIEKSIIKNTPKYKDAKSDFKRYHDSGKVSRAVLGTSLAVGAGLLATGFILSF